MKCPDCGVVDMLSTIESLQGLAGCDFIKQDGPEWNGRTDVLYDTSTTIGVSCQQCGWEHEGGDWIEKLVVS
jgi:hypothetical protein